jgi:hypothetical protein
VTDAPLTESSWWAYPWGQPSALGWQGALPTFGRGPYDGWLPLGPAFGRRTDQQGRDTPAARSEFDLDLIRWTARVLADLNPVAVGALEGLVDFIVCEGMMATASPKSVERAKDGDVLKLVKQTQDVIDEFYDANAYDELQAELVRRSRRDGEYFLRGFDEGGTLAIRPVEPEQVTEQDCPDEPGWSMGSQHLVTTDEGGEDVEDTQTVVAFNLKYSSASRAHVVAAQGAPGYETEGSWVQHVKVNVDRSIKRGLSDFLPVAEAMEGVKDYLRALRKGGVIQARIIGVREIEADLSAGQAFQSSNRTAQYVAPDGTLKDYQQIDDATILTVRGAKYTPNPWTNEGSEGHLAICQAVYRMIGNRWRMPEYMVSGDASNANYSSTLVAGASFPRWCKRQQKFYKRRFAVPVWEAVRLACEAGRVEADYETLRGLVDIQMGAPEPDVVAPLDQAQIDWGDMDRGVLSPKSRRHNRGADDEQERANIAAEPQSVIPGRASVLGQGGPGQGPGTVTPAPRAGGGGGPFGEGQDFFPRRRPTNGRPR